MIWSKSLIPNNSLHLLNRKVSLISVLLGVGSPLGWLWVKIMLEEFEMMAVLKISDGVVFKVLIEPIETIDIEDM